MPIKWNTLRVIEAVDMIEEYINQAIEPLEQIRIVAREARNIDNLPEYVSQYFVRLIGEVEREVGGSQWEPVGRLRACLTSIREALPDEAVKAEQVKLRHGTTQVLL